MAECKCLLCRLTKPWIIIVVIILGLILSYFVERDYGELTTTGKIFHTAGYVTLIFLAVVLVILSLRFFIVDMLGFVDDQE